jgi:hypothetical protein
MDESAVNEILDEIVSSLEPLEAQNTAILHFLKAKGIANDKDLAPFLEEAANASNVRWRAFRLRTAALISSAMKPPEAPEKEPQPQKDQPPKAQATEAASGKQQKGQPPAEPTPEAHTAVDEEKSGARKNDAPKKQQDEAA